MSSKKVFTSQNVSLAEATSDDTTKAKLLSMLLLGLSSLFMILLPIVLVKILHKTKRDVVVTKHGTRTKYVLSLFLSFGGGVLLSTTFLHLLPEVHEGVESLTNLGILPSELPIALPELIMCLGFFTMYIVEEVVHTYLQSQDHRRHPKKFDIEMGPEITVLDCTDMNKGMSKSCAKVTLIDSELIPPEEFDDDRRGSFRQTHIDTTFPPVAEDKIYTETVKISQSTKSYGSNHEESSTHEEHNHFGHEHIPIVENPVFFRELLIVIALTVHEVFEGLAIGLETHLASVWYLFTAVAIHKSVIAFCIGVEMVSANTKLSLAVVYAMIFAIASPLGIGFGLILDNKIDFMEVLSVILQGMATGTLLYVVFFEVLKRDPGHRNGGLLQMLAILVGFVMMAGLQTVLG